MTTKSLGEGYSDGETRGLQINNEIQTWVDPPCGLSPLPRLTGETFSSPHRPQLSSSNFIVPISLPSGSETPLTLHSPLDHENTKNGPPPTSSNLSPLHSSSTSVASLSLLADPANFWHGEREDTLVRMLLELSLAEKEPGKSENSDSEVTDGVSCGGLPTTCSREEQMRTSSDSGFMGPWDPQEVSMQPARPAVTPRFRMVGQARTPYSEARTQRVMPATPVALSPRPQAPVLEADGLPRCPLTAEDMQASLAAWPAGSQLSNFDCPICGRAASSPFHWPALSTLSAPPAANQAAAPPAASQAATDSVVMPPLPATPLPVAVTSSVAPTDVSNSSSNRLSDLSRIKQEWFPRFKGTAEWSDPYEFLNELERVFDRYGIPEQHKLPVLIGCMPDRATKQWVERELVGKDLSWPRIRVRFERNYLTPGYANRLDAELQRMKQSDFSSASAYCEEFRVKVARLGYEEDTEFIVRLMEKGLSTTMREKVYSSLMYHEEKITGDLDDDTRESLSSQGIMFANLAALETEVKRMERIAQHTSAGRNEAPRAFIRRRALRGRRAPLVAAAAAPRRATAVAKRMNGPRVQKRVQWAPTVARLEPSPDGRPTHARAAPQDGRVADRGRGRGRGRGGRPSSRGRGGGLASSAARAPAPSSSPNQVPLGGACWSCGQTGHKRQDCPSAARPPRSRNMRVAPLSAACVARNSHRDMVLTSAVFPSQAYTDILVDTGAQFSSINLSLVESFKLKVHAPRPGEPQFINGATSNMRTPRLGHVDIPVCVHLPLTPRSEVTFASKRFEVVKTDSDFIFGIELLRELFPDDVLLQFVGPHSCITDAPRPSVVVAARMSIRGESPYVVDEDVDESPDLPVSVVSSADPTTISHPLSPMSAAAASSDQ